MQKLQEMIDAAFSEQAERVPQRPSERSLDRERAFGEQAKKVKALRQARLRSDSPQSTPAAVLFDIVRHRGHWRILHRNRHSRPYPDQPAAILAAIQLARKKRELGHPVEVRLIRTDGQVVVQPVDAPQDG